MTCISWTAWPLLLVLCIVGTEIGFRAGAPVIGFNITYFSLAFVLLVLERLMPHEEQWTKPDGQLGQSLPQRPLRARGRLPAGLQHLVGVERPAFVQ